MRNMVILPFAVLALALATVPGHAADLEARILMEHAGIRVTFGQPDWLTISVDGVPFSSRGTFHVVKPGWSGRYFGYQDDPSLPRRVQVEKSQGFHELRLPLMSRAGDFQGTQTIRISDQRRLTISADIRMTTPASAILEHQMAAIAPGWLIGRPVTVDDGENSKQIAVPVDPVSSDLKAATMARNIRSMTVDSRLGPLKITVEGNVPVSLVDYRANRWAEGRLYYWFGVLDSPLRQPEQYAVHFNFPPMQPESTNAALEVSASMGSMPLAPLAVLPEEARDIIIPTPKQVEWRNAERNFSLGTTRTVESLEKQVVRTLSQEWKKRSPAPDGRKSAPAGVRIDASGITVLPDLQDVPSSKSDEWYSLDVDRDVINAHAATATGMQHAFSTLRQLVRRNGTSVQLRACSIEEN